jgi:hypothetical protein
MSVPDFDPTPDDHVFEAGDKIYVIDGNGTDLLEARILKKYTRGYLVHFEDDEEEDTKFKDNRRLLLRNDTNAGIFAAQEILRKRHPPAPPEPEPEEEDFEYEVPSAPRSRPRASRPRPPKTPVFSPEAYVKSAYAAGIKTAENFKAYLADQTKEAVRLFENQRLQLEIPERPLFKLGGGHSDSDITAFWAAAKDTWNELFGSEVSIPTELFVRKAAEAFRNSTQDTAVVRSLLRRTFAPSPGERFTLAEFCSLLAEFGPISSLFQKLSDYWNCSDLAREGLQPIDIASFSELSQAQNEECNSFEIVTTDGPRTVYNRVSVDADGEYLVDDTDRTYKSWPEFCEANPPTVTDTEEEDT